MSASAIRFIVAKGTQAQSGSIQLLCHVKPGVSAHREGIAMVTEEQIEVCVAARAQDGEANKAVREVIAKALKIPKSDIEIAKGQKSRDKTVMVKNINTKVTTPAEYIEKIKIMLQESVE